MYFIKNTCNKICRLKSDLKSELNMPPPTCHVYCYEKCSVLNITLSYSFFPLAGNKIERYLNQVLFGEERLKCH